MTSTTCCILESVYARVVLSGIRTCDATFPYGMPHGYRGSYVFFSPFLHFVGCREASCMDRDLAFGFVDRMKFIAAPAVVGVYDEVKS